MLLLMEVIMTLWLWQFHREIKMRKKIWLIVLGLGWILFVGFILYVFVYQAQVTRHEAEIVKHREEAFMQGVNALQNRMVQELKTQGSLRITIDGEERVFVPDKKRKKK